MSHTPKHPEGNDSSDKEQAKTRQAQTTPGGFCSRNQSVLSFFPPALTAESLQEAAQKALQSVLHTAKAEGRGQKGRGIAGCNQITGGQSSSCLRPQTRQKHFWLQTGLVSSHSTHFFYTRTMKVIVEYGKLNEAALLFSLSVFFSPHQSDIRSRLGHSKKQRKKKKRGNLKLPHPHPPPLSSSSFPSLFLVSLILCEKLKASVVRA